MIIKNLFKVKKTARYFSIGEMNASTEEIWIVLHGYGQLAEFFIRKFQILENGKTFIVAPEALNHFYLEGFSGRVGATWMTKEEREMEIADYIQYFDDLFEHLFSRTDFSKVRLNVLGFSQGVAAACRWVVASRIPVSKLILWAGIFPPDLNTDFVFSVDALKEKNVEIVYGSKDPMLKEEHLREINNLKKIKRDLIITVFEGGHEIKEEVVAKLR